jgi:hypothetical protein
MPEVWKIFTPRVVKSEDSASSGSPTSPASEVSGTGEWQESSAPARNIDSAANETLLAAGSTTDRSIDGFSVQEASAPENGSFWNGFRPQEIGLGRGFGAELTQRKQVADISETGVLESVSAHMTPGAVAEWRGPEEAATMQVSNGDLLQICALLFR